MSVVTRFAPSPTGRLHAGNLRTAILNWLFARKHGGQFLLRLDDTDRTRSTLEFAAHIRSDLAWLGLTPDAEFSQSARLSQYDIALERLIAAGRAYPAWDTPEELEIKRRIQRASGKAPVYDRGALHLTEHKKASFAAAGRAPHWRFLLETGTHVHWDDLIRGPTHLDPASISDPIIRREDGSWLYMLPSVVDDIEFGVTHVIRGEDHVPNSAVQLQMFAALGASAPVLAHASLLVGTEGALSKRLGSLDCDTFRADGIEPSAVVAFLARLGSADPIEPFANLAPLVEGFDLGRLGRAPAKFNLEDLKALSARTVHLLPYSAVASRLSRAVTPALWEAVRGNLARIDEAADWVEVVSGDLAAPDALDADRAFLAAALAALPAEPWDTSTWNSWTGALGAATGRRGAALFRPLRLAITGRDRGPEMAALLPLIGSDRVRTRIAALVQGSA